MVPELLEKSSNESFGENVTELMTAFDTFNNNGAWNEMAAKPMILDVDMARTSG
jgi:hypothetical protein